MITATKNAEQYLIKDALVPLVEVVDELELELVELDDPVLVMLRLERTVESTTIVFKSPVVDAVETDAGSVYTFALIIEANPESPTVNPLDEKETEEALNDYKLLGAAYDPLDELDPLVEFPYDATP